MQLFKTTHVLLRSAKAILAKADKQNQLFQFSCLSRHNKPQTQDLPPGEKTAPERNTVLPSAERGAAHTPRT